LERLASDVTPGITRLVGQVSDPERWFAAADVLLHAPRLEAFGLVLVQAMACGAPVVASAVGGIPEIVVEGQTGMLAAPDPASLGERLAQVLGDDRLRLALAAGALERAGREYDADRFAARTRGLYDAVLGLRPDG
jgi:glycosyltransferase involved in cell wall biosynthesis